MAQWFQLCQIWVPSPRAQGSSRFLRSNWQVKHCQTCGWCMEATWDDLGLLIFSEIQHDWGKYFGKMCIFFGVSFSKSKIIVGKRMEKDELCIYIYVYMYIYICICICVYIYILVTPCYTWAPALGAPQFLENSSSQLCGVWTVRSPLRLNRSPARRPKKCRVHRICQKSFHETEKVAVFWLFEQQPGSFSGITRLSTSHFSIHCTCADGSCTWWGGERKSLANVCGFKKRCF